jgi:hypothetical protein
VGQGAGRAAERAAERAAGGAAGQTAGRAVEHFTVFTLLISLHPKYVLTRICHGRNLYFNISWEGVA